MINSDYILQKKSDHKIVIQQDIVVKISLSKKHNGRGY